MRRPTLAAIALSIVVVGSAMTLTGMVGVARASSSTPSVHDWFMGYAGNASVYPTKDPTDYYAPAIQASSSQVDLNQYCESGSSLRVDGVGLNDTVNVNIGKPSVEVNYQWLSGGKQFAIFFETSVTGGSTVLPPLSVGGSWWYVGMVATQVGFSGIPGDATDFVLQDSYLGANMTTGNIGGTSQGNDGNLAEAIAAGLDVASLVFPEWDLVIVPSAIMAHSVGAAGAANFGTQFSSQSTGTGNTLLDQFGMVDNGTFYPYDSPQTTSLGGLTFGSNTYSEAIEWETQYNDVALDTVGQISVNGWNYMFSRQDGYPAEYQCLGGTAGLSYPINPAISIGGYVNLSSGAPVSGAIVELFEYDGSTATNIYNLKTDASGHWHFFAHPGDTYYYSVAGDGLGNQLIGIPSSETSTANTGAVVSPLHVTVSGKPMYSATFRESGIPSGYDWSVQLGTVAKSAPASDSITFSGLAGAYPFQVPTIAIFTGCTYIHYYANPSTGDVTTWVNISVSFSTSPPPSCGAGPSSIGNPAAPILELSSDPKG